MPEIRLHLREADGDLPDVCMLCAEPATAVRTKNMQWCPPWVGVLLLAGLLPYVIVALILTKRARVQGPFCDEHKGHWLNRTLMIWGSLVLVGLIELGVLVIFVATTGNNDQSPIGGFACLGGMLLLLAWVIFIIILQNTAIRPREITDKEIVLKGVSDGFVEAVREADLAYRARAKKRRSRIDDEEDEDEDRPRKRMRIVEDDEEEDRPHKGKRPPSDAIEE